MQFFLKTPQDKSFVLFVKSPEIWRIKIFPQTETTCFCKLCQEKYGNSGQVPVFYKTFAYWLGQLGYICKVSLV
jgi:hypothetical protein